jgi:hypothetical protein
MSFFQRIAVLGSICFTAILLPCFSQIQGDFRTYTSGLWHESSSWEIFDGAAWNPAQPGQIPDSTTSVWIQRDHIITLQAFGSVFNLHINAGRNASDGSGNGRVLIGDHVLSLHGILRTYRAEEGSIPGIDWSGFTGPTPLGLSTSAIGALKVVGEERFLTAPGSYSDRISRFRMVIDVEEDVAIHLNTRFRASEIDIVSGVLDAHDFSVRCEAEASDGIPERFIIRNNARFKSAASGPGNMAVLARGNTSSMETLVIEPGAVLELGGQFPHIRVKNIHNEGTIRYSGDQNQTFIQADGSDAPFDPIFYNTLVLDGEGAKIIDNKVLQISDSLIIQGEASLSSINGGGLSYTSPNAWLVYRGSKPQTPTVLEWVQGVSSFNILLDNPSGLIVPQMFEISGEFRFRRGKVSNDGEGILRLLPGGKFEGMDQESYIEGAVEVSGNNAVFLPIGGSGFYKPLLAQIEGSMGHIYRVEVVGQAVEGMPAEPLVELLGQFHWQLSTIAGNLEDGTITFFYDPALFPFSSSDLAIAFSKTSSGLFHARPITNSVEGEITVLVNPEGYYSLGTLTPFGAQYFHFFEVYSLLQKKGVGLRWKLRQDDLSESILVYRSRNGLDWQLIKTLDLNPLPIENLEMQLDDYPNRSGFWYYQVEHRRSKGESFFSEVLRASVISDPLLPIMWLDAKGDYIHLRWAQSSTNGQFFIFNTNGHQVLRGKKELHSEEPIAISISSLPSGLYFLTIEGEGGRLLSKRFFKP